VGPPIGGALAVRFGWRSAFWAGTAAAGLLLIYGAIVGRVRGLGTRGAEAASQALGGCAVLASWLPMLLAAVWACVPCDFLCSPPPRTLPCTRPHANPNPNRDPTPHPRTTCHHRPQETHHYRVISRVRRAEGPEGVAAIAGAEFIPRATFQAPWRPLGYLFEGNIGPYALIAIIAQGTMIAGGRQCACA
jgi:hypothetical protein